MIRCCSLNGINVRSLFIFGVLWMLTCVTLAVLYGTTIRRVRNNWIARFSSRVTPTEHVQLAGQDATLHLNKSQLIESEPKEPAQHCDLVMFTTFKINNSKANEYVLKNWAQFLPNNLPVLFLSSMTANKALTVTAKSLGWIVTTVPKSNSFGMPVLQGMFHYVKEHFPKCKHYLYANGDIMFNGDLSNTTKALLEHRDTRIRIRKPYLLSGQRWNFPLFLNSLGDNWLSGKVHLLKSKKSHESALDYFVFSRDFPWSAYKEVVVGRPLYDNYLVFIANKLNLSTIDATETITAVHLSESYSIAWGTDSSLDEDDRNYNRKVIGDLFWGHGTTTQMNYETLFDKNDVVIRSRKLGKGR